MVYKYNNGQDIECERSSADASSLFLQRHISIKDRLPRTLFMTLVLITSSYTNYEYQFGIMEIEQLSRNNTENSILTGNESA
jgi:hypothetical protein